MNLAEKSTTLIFSHRGASLEAPENTPCAFDKSLEYGIDGIETDVQLSRDDIAVLWHDRFMEKLGFPNRRIDDYDFDTLTRLHLPESFTQGQQEAHLISLQSFISRYHQRCRLLIEAKNREWDKHSGRHKKKMRECVGLAKQLTDAETRKNILISSFDLESLQYTHRHASEWPLIYNSEQITDRSSIPLFFEENPFIKGLCLPIENLNQALVDTIQQLHRSVATYPCATNKDILKALDIGVDILITDDPKTAVQLRQ